MGAEERRCTPAALAGWLSPAAALQTRLDAGTPSWMFNSIHAARRERFGCRGESWPAGTAAWWPLAHGSLPACASATHSQSFALTPGHAAALLRHPNWRLAAECSEPRTPRCRTPAPLPPAGPVHQRSGRPPEAPGTLRKWATAETHLGALSPPSRTRHPPCPCCSAPWRRCAQAWAAPCPPPHWRRRWRRRLAAPPPRPARLRPCADAACCARPCWASSSSGDAAGD